jgi:DNA-binding CsgD family transcriptional regulator
MLLCAAEAAAEAVAAHRRAGLAARARRSEGRAKRLLVGCPDVRTPPLQQMVRTPGLTRREREVSRMAADGLSNHEVAARLGVNVRTVEGHILRATAKLGVRNRGELADALDGGENA